MPIDSPPTSQYDVAIAGAGPAGSSIAIRLANAGCRVALVEASEFTLDRFGSTLPPEVRPVLEDLGVWDIFQATDPLPSPGLLSAWGHADPVEYSFVGNPYGCGWHVNRNRLDAALFNAAAGAGAMAYARTRVTSCEPPSAANGGCWRLDTTNALIPAIEARFLVDACGVSGVRSPLPRTRIKDDTLLAAVIWMDYPEGSVPSDARTVVETVPCGWWYWAPLPEPGRAWAMFFTDRTEQSENGIDMAHILQHAPLLRSRRANSRIIRSRLVPVRSHCQLEMTGDSWLLAGDRAATFDPLSGMGVFQAWAHSKAAADAVLAALKGQPETASAHYQQTLTATWHRYRTERIAHYQSEPRWPESHFWQRRRVHSQAHLEQTHH